MRALTIIIIMITTMPQVRVKATDLLLVKVVTDSLEVSYNETEANVSFRIIDTLFSGKSIKQLQRLKPWAW